MRFRTTGYQPKSALRQAVSLMLVLLVSCSLVSMGGMLWINNSWAFFPDDDPATKANISFSLDGQAGDDFDSKFDPDGDGQIPLAGGKLIKGNGDQDDNKEREFILCRRFDRVIEFKPHPTRNSFATRRVTMSYKDFGHLKVRPAGDGLTSIISIVF